MKVRTRLQNEAMDCNGAGEVLLVRKPIDWSSFDVVKKMRSLLGARKIGHAGTLDPKATGLLIVCTGPKTKLMDTFTELEKEYCGTLELGIETASFDSETAVIERRATTHVTAALLGDAAVSLTGKQTQVPPMYSAAKYGGRPLYYYARKGRTVHREAKEIDVKEFTITGIDMPLASFRIVCSKGTYIRSLVSDLGKRLGCGAALRSLERTRIGSFVVDDAFTIEELERLCEDRGNSERVPNDYRASA